MRIQADEMMFHLNLTKVSEHLQAWYQNNKEHADSITTDSGRRIDFKRKSIARLALNAALVPIAIPSLRMLYALKGAEIPPHDKHEDLIDYCCMTMLGFIGVLDEGYLYVETLEGAGHDSRIINSISTNEPALIGTGSDRGQEAEETPFSPGREAYLYSGQNGNGENQTHEGDNPQES